MSSIFRRTAIATLVTGSASAFAQPPAVDYALSFDNAVHHEATITSTFTGAKGDYLDVRMSRSSPGRYAIHEFAKNVYDVTAVNHNGKALAVERVSPYAWRVKNDPAGVKITYTLFANRADGTYSGIDETHAHLNFPATLMWSEALADAPVSVSFSPFSDDWKVATQLAKTSDPYAFTAPDLQYLMDSPTELSDMDIISWKQESAGTSYTINLAVHDPGTFEDVEAFVEKAKKVVATQMDIFGELADFDYGEYTFIACYMPQVSGDGMEHRNSTILTNALPLFETELGRNGHIRTLSHEFFHSWNVERIRPADLEPFDFTQANPTTNLWFAEGFTSYYGELTLKLTGEYDNDIYYDKIAGAINAVKLRNGPKHFSPEGMSLQAPFVDAATAIDPTNFGNTFLSYYTYGHGLGIALDLMIRSEFPGKSLNDVMKQAWKTLGKPEKAYNADDVQKALADAVGDEAFAADFFKRYIHGQEIPDYEALLKNAGLTLELESPDTASLGPVSTDFSKGAAMISSGTIAGTPLYDAGLEKGDAITHIGRYNTRDKARWDLALENFKPGDTTTIRFKRFDEELETEVTFYQKPDLEITEMADDDVSEKATAFREAWLGKSAE